MLAEVLGVNRSFLGSKWGRSLHAEGSGLLKDLTLGVRGPEREGKVGERKPRGGQAAASC